MRLVWLWAFFGFLPTCKCENKTSSNKLIVLIIDSLPWKRISEETDLPSFAQMKQEGTTVEYLQPVFPTVGYPNYFSLLTGLYPEEHGIVDEYMYDSRDTKSFFVRGTSVGDNSTNVQWFQKGELFWTTAQNQDRRVAVYGWPSCNHSETAAGPKPKLCHQGTKSSVRRSEMKESYDFADQALTQIENNTIDIAFLFVDQLDYVGRSAGLNSLQFNSTLTAIDEFLGYVKSRVDNASLSANTNTIVVSTHGLSSLIRPPLVIDISRFSEDVKSAVTFFPGGSRVIVYPKPGAIVRTFNNLYLRHRHMNVYWKWNMPSKWRLRNGRFTAAILAVADPGWAVAASKNEALFLSSNRGGLDGYDPDKSEDMRGVFMAAGPDFKQNYMHQPTNVTDIYNLLCRIAEIKAANNSGRWSNVADMLETDSDHQKNRTAFTKPPPIASTFSTPASPENATSTPADSGNISTTAEGNISAVLVNETNPPMASNGTVSWTPMDNNSSVLNWNMSTMLAEGSGHMDVSNLTLEELAIANILMNVTKMDEGSGDGDPMMESSGWGHQNWTQIENVTAPVADDRREGNETKNATITVTTVEKKINATENFNATEENMKKTIIIEIENGTTANMTTALFTGSGNATDNAKPENATPEAKIEGSAEGSGEMESVFKNESIRHRRADQFRILAEIDTAAIGEQNLAEIDNVTLINGAEIGCECSEKMCTTTSNDSPCQNDEQNDTKSKIRQSTEGVNEEDGRRAEVEVHDWRDSLGNFGRNRTKRAVDLDKDPYDLSDTDELGSGDINIQTTSTADRTSHDNRSDLSIRFNHRIQNGQQSSNTNNAYVRSQRYELNGGLLVQNRFLDFLRPMINFDQKSQSADTRNTPTGLNQFNVADGGRATQIIIQQPVVNIVWPREETPEEPESTTEGVSAVYSILNKKSRIEILDYNNEDDL